MSEQAPHATHRRYLTKTDGNIKFALMMAAFLLLAWLAQGAQDRQDDQLHQVITNTDAICSSRNMTIVKVNALIDELETSVRQGSTLPSGEQADRLLRYEALKVPLITCVPTK